MKMSFQSLSTCSQCAKYFFFLLCFCAIDLPPPAVVIHWRHAVREGSALLCYGTPHSLVLDAQMLFANCHATRPLWVMTAASLTQEKGSSLAHQWASRMMKEGPGSLLFKESASRIWVFWALWQLTNLTLWELWEAQKNTPESCSQRSYSAGSSKPWAIAWDLQPPACRGNLMVQAKQMVLRQCLKWVSGPGSQNGRQEKTDGTGGLRLTIRVWYPCFRTASRNTLWKY